MAHDSNVVFAAQLSPKFIKSSTELNGESFRVDNIDGDDSFSRTSKHEDGIKKQVEDRKDTFFGFRTHSRASNTVFRAG